MTKKPELSIVIISYNTQDMTRECLESVYANASGLDLEIIVVDNASSDGSVEMIEQWRRHYLTLRPHSALNYKPPAPQSFIPVDLRPTVHYQSGWIT